MERILQPDTILHFDKITGTFLIKQMIGRGSSCVTYLSEYSNSEGNRNEYLLKEYIYKNCPGSVRTRTFFGSKNSSERFLRNLFPFTCHPS